MNKTVLVADTIFELTEQLEQLEHFSTTHSVTHVVYYVYPEYCAAEIKYN